MNKPLFLNLRVPVYVYMYIQRDKRRHVTCRVLSAMVQRKNKAEQGYGTWNAGQKGKGVVFR